MKNVYIYCEGQSEESFISNILCPYLVNIGIVAIPIVCTTSRNKSKKYRGGVTTYNSLRFEL